MLVHGWSCDATDWASLIPVLRQHSRVIVFDQRGHGESGMPPGDPATAFTPAAMATDLSALLDHLGLGRVILVAHSAGAEVAAEFAMTHPGRVAAVAFSDPAFGVDPADRPRLESIADLLDRASDGSRVAEYFAAVEEPPALALAHRALALRARPAVTAAMFRGFNLAPGTWHFAPETTTRLSGRDWPMFVAYRNDERARLGCGLAREGDLVIVLQGGHWPHQEHETAFVSTLLAWLDEAV
ncbi:alpha/beta fold hydrolase [Agromyces bauzanensis]